METQLILITNPGSSSRKYALYEDNTFLASLHFEREDGKIICTLDDSGGEKTNIPVKFDSLGETVSNIHRILEETGYITPAKGLSAIVARIAAPGDYFTRDRIVDDEFVAELDAAKDKAPLHVPTAAAEINHFRKSFSKTPIIAVSDSAFQWAKPDLMKYYPVDTDLADKHDIKRYGFHGLSVGSVVEHMKKEDILPEKLIVCHIGSGSSVSAVFGGVAMDTSMGYSPLEGVMMATRSGSIDLAAALAIKRALKFDDDDLEKYLNKKAGLLGVSDATDDMREILQKRDEGDPKATFAHALYIYRLQSVIGQMAASLGGADAIVFTATIGERSAQVRHSITQKLAYLGFSLDPEKNETPTFSSSHHAEIAAENSKPIYIVRTNESAEMVRKALIVLSASE